MYNDQFYQYIFVAYTFWSVDLHEKIKCDLIHGQSFSSEWQFVQNKRRSRKKNVQTVQQRISKKHARSIVCVPKKSKHHYWASLSDYNCISLSVDAEKKLNKMNNKKDTERQRQQKKKVGKQKYSFLNVIWSTLCAKSKLQLSIISSYKANCWLF